MSGPARQGDRDAPRRDRPSQRRPRAGHHPGGATATRPRPPRPLDVVYECLDLALQAPTGFNEQNWRWLVVTDPGIRKAIGEVWPAAWSFMLALRSRGLGSSLTMIHLGAEAEVARLLDVPEGVSQAGLIPVAWFRGEDFRRAARRPLEEVAFHGRWGQPIDRGE